MTEENIYIQQLDHLTFTMYAECLDDYLDSEFGATGLVKVEFDGRPMFISIYWAVVFIPSKVRKNEDELTITFMPRVEITGREIEDFPWHRQVSEAELNNWLDEFVESCKIYDDVIASLPLPEIDEDDVLDVAQARRDLRYELSTSLE